MKRRPQLRFPHLGPAAIGCSIILGYILGYLSDSLDLAVVGVMIGMILGDILDQCGSWPTNG